jgi:hypothetical protein
VLRSARPISFILRQPQPPPRLTTETRRVVRRRTLGGALPAAINCQFVRAGPRCPPRPVPSPSRSQVLTAGAARTTEATREMIADSSPIVSPLGVRCAASLVRCVSQGHPFAIRRASVAVAADAAVSVSGFRFRSSFVRAPFGRLVAIARRVRVLISISACSISDYAALLSRAGPVGSAAEG